MADVFRSRLNWFHGDGFTLTRDTGTTVTVEGKEFVSQYKGLMLLPRTSEWHGTQRDADMAVLPELEKRRREIDAITESITTADTGRSGCDSSAIV
jgi:hypothetical protein